MSTQYEAWKASHDQVMLEMTRDKWENKFVKQFVAWPPPDWTECVVTWDWIMSDAGCHPHDMHDWCEQHASRYHVHGWRSTEGFAFRFEDPRDAVMFKLTWTTL